MDARKFLDQMDPIAEEVYNAYDVIVEDQEVEYEIDDEGNQVEVAKEETDEEGESFNAFYDYLSLQDSILVQTESYDQELDIFFELVSFDKDARLAVVAFSAGETEEEIEIGL